MKPPFSKCKIDWLCDTQSQVDLDDADSWHTYSKNPLPEGAGGGWVEILTLDRGISVSRATHGFEKSSPNKTVTVGRVHAELPEPAFIVQSLRSGQVTIQENTLARSFIITSDNSLFQNVDQLDFVPILDCSLDIEVTLLKIGYRPMASIIGEPLYDSLTSALKINAVPSANVMRVPQSISSILYRSLGSNGTQGTLKQLFTEARILDYLCLLTEHFTDKKNRSSKNKREIIAAGVHDELTKMGGKLPTLSQLANQYGLTAKSLNEAFKENYGEPIVSFITNQRLSEAHYALKESDVAIKVLASRLGYSHVNHFITAFRRKYGYPPGKLRKQENSIKTANISVDD
jgi:AraC-like DNA-binding protein